MVDRSSPLRGVRRACACSSRLSTNWRVRGACCRRRSRSAAATRDVASAARVRSRGYAPVCSKWSSSTSLSTNALTAVGVETKTVRRYRRAPIKCEGAHRPAQRAGAETLVENCACKVEELRRNELYDHRAFGKHACEQRRDHGSLALAHKHLMASRFAASRRRDQRVYERHLRRPQHQVLRKLEDQQTWVENGRDRDGCAVLSKRRRRQRMWQHVRTASAEQARQLRCKERNVGSANSEFSLQVSRHH
eukprot:6195862-Pleurochrysis_carterae.AAC.1